jgi:hypothetical protein
MVRDARTAWGLHALLMLRYVAAVVAVGAKAGGGYHSRVIPE